MTEHEKMQAYLQERLPFYLQLLREMVEINSFTANAEGVDKLGALTAKVFAELGFSAEFIPSANPTFGKHLVLTRPGNTERRVGFVSHLDTVYSAAEEVQNDFRWREEGSRIYGPGTVDIKGGTVIMFMVLDALREVAPQIVEDTSWVLLFDAAEEVDGKDFGELCLERLKGPGTAGCLIFEGGRVEGGMAHVVVARKGMAVYRLEVEGRSAHAGSAHGDGANAIVQLAELIQKIAGFTDYERNLTFNVGTVDGGSVVNRVPHTASAMVEMRAFSPVVYDDGLAKMLALADQATVSSADGDYDCRVSVEVTRRTAPWSRNEATDGLFAVWREAGEEIGLTVVPEERGGLSDGNYFWRELPSLDALGASGGNAHCSERSADGSKEQEFVSRDSLVPKATLNAAAVLKLLRGSA